MWEIGTGMAWHDKLYRYYRRIGIGDVVKRSFRRRHELGVSYRRLILTAISFCVIAHITVKIVRHDDNTSLYVPLCQLARSQYACTIAKSDPIDT